MNAATKTIVTTSAISTVLIRRYASKWNRGSGWPLRRAARTRMNANTRQLQHEHDGKQQHFTQKNPFLQ